MYRSEICAPTLNKKCARATTIDRATSGDILEKNAS